MLNVFEVAISVELLKSKLHMKKAMTWIATTPKHLVQISIQENYNQITTPIKF